MEAGLFTKPIAPSFRTASEVVNLIAAPRYVSRKIRAKQVGLVACLKLRNFEIIWNLTIFLQFRNYKTIWNNPIPYALCRMPYTLWITFLLNFFSVSKFRNYEIIWEKFPMPYDLCPMPFPYRKHFSRFLFAILELRNYLGNNSPVFFLLFRNFEITRLFGEKCPLPYALCPIPYG